MRERPILFSGAMVRAILAGTKTQTRRVAPIRELNILSQPGDMVAWSVSFLKAIKGVLSSHSGGRFSALQARSIIASQFCPYGQPGDRLWVRETYMPDPPDDGTWAGAAWRGCMDSRLEDIPERFRTAAHCLHRATWQGHDLVGWRPSIHMPRWASRLTLEITGVRVERLQDISEADALAEGIVHLKDGGFGLPAGEHYHCADPRQSYLSLWEAINGPGSWDANPWVWVVEFKRLDTPAA